MYLIFHRFQTYRPVIIYMNILKMLLNLPHSYSQSTYEVWVSIKTRIPLWFQHKADEWLGHYLLPAH